MQQFEGPVGLVAGRDIHVHPHPAAPPAHVAPAAPVDPAQAVACWQCRRPTWRYTAECVHCRVSLARGWIVRLLQRLPWRA